MSDTALKRKIKQLKHTPESFRTNEYILCVYSYTGVLFYYSHVGFFPTIFLCKTHNKKTRLYLKRLPKKKNDQCPRDVLKIKHSVDRSLLTPALYWRRWRNGKIRFSSVISECIIYYSIKKKNPAHWLTVGYSFS